MDFIKLSPDQVLEVEFVVLPLMRRRPGLGGKGPVDRVLLIDEFNSVLPGTAMRSSKNSSDPANKSRVYPYQALRNIARGSICSSEDENIFRFRKSSNIHRNNQWSNISSIAYRAGMPFLLAE